MRDKDNTKAIERYTGDLPRYAEAATRERLEKLASRLRRAARRPDDPDAIHDLRVSIRRFNESLRVFRGLFDNHERKKMRRRLSKLMDLCGAVRNCDIAFEILDASSENGQAPPTDGVKLRLRRFRERARRKLDNALKRFEARKVLTGWRALLKAHGGPRRNKAVAPLARDILLPLARGLFRAGAIAARPGARYREMHRFRLAAKRFRYSLELFGPACDTEPRRRDWNRGLEIMRGLQNRLGSINDGATTLALLEEIGLAKSELRRFRASLTSLIEERSAAFRAYWHQQFTPATRHWWLAWLNRIGSPASRPRPSHART